MAKIIKYPLIPFVIVLFALTAHAAPQEITMKEKATRTINLPQPAFGSKTSVEEALLHRRSVREYKNEPLTLSDISQLLWAAQGITDQADGLRTAPSAGALYPMEIYIVAGKVQGLAPGTYKYKPDGHELVRIMEGDKRTSLYNAALHQSPIKDAPAVMVLCAVYERVTIKYGERGIRYVHMEAGHVAQNIYLQSVSLGLGTVVIGAFDDDGVQRAIGAQSDEYPLCIMPVGKN